MTAWRALSVTSAACHSRTQCCAVVGDTCPRLSFNRVLSECEGQDFMSQPSRASSPRSREAAELNRCNGSTHVDSMPSSSWSAKPLVQRWPLGGCVPCQTSGSGNCPAITTLARNLTVHMLYWRGMTSWCHERSKQPFQPCRKDPAWFR